MIAPDADQSIVTVNSRAIREKHFGQDDEEGGEE
jgi:hypothetical protein